MRSYPKRLIEVDLPIKRISAHARREKSIRHGHISTLHIWWARRPLAACRAVICASLWPDPADPLCPQAFRDTAVQLITAFARKASTNEHLSESCSKESLGRWLTLSKPQGKIDPKKPAHQNVLRFALLDFIADFANWDNSTVPEYLETARALTQAAHEALGGAPGTRSLVADPFAGGGAIPLEALRVGADAFASDLNPVAVLLNKVVLEYIPKYGQLLADEVRKWGQWIKEQAEKELAGFYPKDNDGATPIAYLWARTVTCEGPNCGAEVPLMRSLWLAKKGSRSMALRVIPNKKAKCVDFEIVHNVKAKDVGEGTVKRGAATCPCCGYTTPVESVRRQLKARKGGADDAKLFCVVITRPGEQGRFYRLPNEQDLKALRKAAEELERRKRAHTGELSLVPDEALDIRGIRHTWSMIYGFDSWGAYFTSRQALALAVLAQLVQTLDEETTLHRHSERSEESLPISAETLRFAQGDDSFAAAARACLALAVDRHANTLTSISRWNNVGEKIEGIFARQAIPMMWDFSEANPFSGATGDFDGALQWVAEVCEENCFVSDNGHAEQASATAQPLPDDSVSAVITDPPYYDAVPYAYLSDFFYIWLRRMLSASHPSLFAQAQVPKDAEIVVDRPHELSNSNKDVAFYERELAKAFAESRRVLRPDGIGTIVFASKTTASWEAILQAVVDAGWTITGSWPIDTEMEARVAAQGQSRLASSIHLVCRPRENPDGSVAADAIGDWRDVLAELPQRIHEWMPRLSQEGVVGADAIFACLGPALEIFSRYSRVEKASGEQVNLKEFLVQVWGAVSREALSAIFEGADASGFEEDARLTAIWFWVLKSTAAGEQSRKPDEAATEDTNDEDIASDHEEPISKRKVVGYTMEYDAARKLAQGLGADLNRLSRPGGIITIHGNLAVMNTILTREQQLVGFQLPLFGDESAVKARLVRHGGKSANVTLESVKQRRLSLFADTQPEEEDENQPSLFPKPADRRTILDHLRDGGVTILDRLHQAMLLFGRSHTSLLNMFLVETGAGRDQRFWKLAQALSALYPTSSEEKRWVDGVLARKKGMGF